MMTFISKTALSVSTLALCLMTAPDVFAQDATIKIGGRVMVDYTIADFDEGYPDIRDSEVRHQEAFL